MKHQLHAHQGLSSRLATYAASAGAFMAIGLSSQAQVVYSGEQNLTLNFPDDSVAIDLDGDMINDFAIKMYSTLYSSIFDSSSRYVAGGWGMIFGLRTDTYKNSWITEVSTIFSGTYSGTSARAFIYPVVAAFYPGVVIDADEAGWRYATDSHVYGLLGGSYVGTNITPYYTYSFSWEAGNFTGEEKFVGVRFFIGNDLHYGWIRVSMPEELSPLTIIDWAYEQTPHKAIQAGDGLGIDLPPHFTFSRTGGGTDPNSTITLNATETITGFTIDDVVVTNGTVTHFNEVTPGEVFVMDVEAVFEGEVTLELPQGSFADLADNENYTISFTWDYDITGPYPTFEINDSIVSWSSEPVTLYFNEPVSPLDISDFVLINCSIEEISEWQQPTRTTYIIWVFALSEGSVSVELPAGATQDEAGNPSFAASVSWVYDDSTPQISFSGVPDEVIEASQTITITFSEAIQDFSLEMLEIFNGTASNLVEITPGIEYQLDITADDFGFVTAVVPELSVFDLAGNPVSGDGISWNYVEVNSADNLIAKEISIFPNPANDRITIKLPVEGSVNIMDLQGKIVLTKDHLLKETIDISHLNHGIYIIHAEIQGNTSIHKLVIE